MRGNTITIYLGRGRVGQTGKLFQYDRGQRLLIAGCDLPATYQAHFSNDELGRSKPMIGNSTGVDIPDEYLESGKDVHVWVYVTGEDHAETEYHGVIHVTQRALPTDITPTPAQQTAIDQLVEDLNDAISATEAVADGIPGAIDDALAAAKESGEFDGPPGEPGAPGNPGAPGFSPTLAVSDITGGHRITITDVNGTHYVDVMDGEPGDPGNPGQPGEDGVSPTVTIADISGGHTVTITDKTGDHSFNVMDGQQGNPGDPTTLIDDTAGAGTTNRSWSADKLTSALNQKYTKPSGGIPASDLASGVIPSVPVTDVQVAGTSVLSSGVANVPIISDLTHGVAKIDSAYGISVLTDSSRNGTLRTKIASSSEIKTGTNSYKPIAPSTMQDATFYGLAKAAGDTSQSSSSNAVGTYTEAAKKAICAMIGVQYDAPFKQIREITTTADASDVVINVDDNGLPFSLSEIYVRFEVEVGSASGSCGFLVNTDNIERYILLANALSNSTKQTRMIWAQIKGGRMFGFATTSNQNNNYTNSNIVGNWPCFGRYECGAMTSFKLWQMNGYQIPAGTKITILGR